MRSITAKTTRNILKFFGKREVLTIADFDMLLVCQVTADYQDVITDFKGFSCLFAYFLTK